MHTQISHILVRADDLNDAVCEVEAVLEPNNWDFLKMVTPVEDNNRQDGLKPLNAAEIGADGFIKILKDFDRKRAARIKELIGESGNLTINQLIIKKPDEIFRVSEALRLADGCFLQNSPFLYASDIITDVSDSLIAEIKKEPEAFFLVPVELMLV